MPKCSLMHCGLQQKKGVTLHKLPRSEDLRQQWLDIIGTKNINPLHKQVVVCSLHFDESCINKDISSCNRLIENSVPSRSLQPEITLQNACYPPSRLLDQQSHLINQLLQQQSDVINQLCEKLEKQRKHIQKLKARVRRRDTKINKLTIMLKDLKKRRLIKNEMLSLSETGDGSKLFQEQPVVCTYVMK